MTVRQKALVVALSGLLSIGTLTACSNQPEQARENDQYTEVCQNIDTGERVDDSQCMAPAGTYHSGWYYLPPSVYVIPAVGTILNSGSRHTPPSHYGVRRKVGPQGFTIPGPPQKRPSFDNSTMKPVPGDFQPPTAAPVPTNTPRPETTRSTGNQTAVPNPPIAPPATVPGTVKSPADAEAEAKKKADAQKAEEQRVADKKAADKKAETKKSERRTVRPKSYTRRR
jgi:hypothetical protein